MTAAILGGQFERWYTLSVWWPGYSTVYKCGSEALVRAMAETCLASGAARARCEDIGLDLPYGAVKS